MASEDSLRMPDEARPDDERDAREVLGPVVLWIVDRAVDVANWFRR